MNGLKRFQSGYSKIGRPHEDDLEWFHREAFIVGWIFEIKNQKFLKYFLPQSSPSTRSKNQNCFEIKRKSFAELCALRVLRGETCFMLDVIRAGRVLCNSSSVRRGVFSGKGV